MPLITSGSRLIRHSGFTPASLANLALWLKADAITALNDGDAVASWTDLSGNGRNAAQSTASLKPLYKTNIINGLPVVRFDADDVLAWSQFSVSNQTIFIVFKPAATITAATTAEFFIRHTSGEASYISFGATTGEISNERMTWVRVSGVNVYAHAYNGGDMAAAATLFTMRFATTPTVSIQSNGSELSLVANAQPFTSLIYPHAYGQIGANANGDYAEIIVYGAALSDTDRAKVEAYLASKYAITLA